MLFCSLICTAVLAMPFPAEDWQPGDPFFPAPDQLPDEPTWIPLDELGALTPGLPPTIEVQGVGDEAMDQFRIVLHGFWVEPFHHLEEEAHERFLTFKIPGMTTLSEVGLPALPTTTFTWGLATVTEQLEIGFLRGSGCRLFRRCQGRTIPRCGHGDGAGRRSHPVHDRRAVLHGRPRRFMATGCWRSSNWTEFEFRWPSAWTGRVRAVSF